MTRAGAWLNWFFGGHILMGLWALGIGALALTSVTATLYLALRDAIRVLRRK